MPQIYRDALVLCITSNSEALPLVIAEAMACGVPVVAPNIGGIPEIIKDESVGRTVSDRSPESFINAIAELTGNPEHYSDISRNARVWVQKAFSLDRMLEEIAVLYKGLLEK
jgi:glycosyltransferase involved in cell wall biosynthesis